MADSLSNVKPIEPVISPPAPTLAWHRCVRCMKYSSLPIHSIQQGHGGWFVCDFCGTQHHVFHMVRELTDSEKSYGKAFRDGRRQDS